MATAVAEHAQATDPQDVVMAEQRLRAQARQVAAGLQADEARRLEHERGSDDVTHRGAYAGDPGMHGDADRPGANEPAGTNRYADPAPGPGYGDPRSDDHIDPATGARTDRYGDPATDPRDDDPKYDGRLGDDYVDPRHDDRRGRGR